MSILLSSACLVFAPFESEARQRSICGVVSWDCGGNEEMSCESSPSCDAGFASYPFDSWDPIACDPFGITTEDIDRFCYDCCGDGEPAGAAGCNGGLTHSRAQDLVGGSIGPCQNLLPADAAPIGIEIDISPLGTLSYSFDPPSSVDLVNARGVCSRAGAVSFSGASRELWPHPTPPSDERSTIFVIHGRGSSCDAGFGALLDTSIYDRNQLAYCVEYDNSPSNAVRIIPVLQDRTGEGPNGCVDMPGGCDFDRSDPVATVTASPFSVEGVADALSRAMAMVPTEGDITLIPHSQGGFVARALLHNHYDDLRWQGMKISRVVSLAHPYFGVLTDPSLATGWACADDSSSFKNCHVSRWLWGYQNWLDSGSPNAIDNIDFPQIEWSAIAGDGDLGLGSNALSSVFPGACIQVFGGVSNSSVMGDGTVPVLSSLGIDEHDFFGVESLDFDEAIEAPSCDHDATCLLAGAIVELGDDLIARAAARKPNETLTFGGDEQVAISDPAAIAALTLPNELTLEAWVRPSSVLGNTTILSKGGEFALEYSAGSFHITLNGFFGGDFVGFGSGVPTEAWTHVAVTHANGILKGYVDGALVHQEAGSPLLDDDPARNELRIGGHEEGTFAPFVGGLDEVRVWSRELTGSEIAAGMSGDPGAGNRTNLQAWWRFDETSGDTLVGSSGSGVDASLASFPDSPWRWGPAREVADGALYFDGNDDRTVIDDPVALSALEMSDALTIEAWVNPRGGDWGAVVSKEGEYQLSRLSDGTIGFSLASVSPGWTTRGTGLPLPERTWTHLALVFDGSQASIYVNGALSHTETAIGPIGDHPSHANEDEVWFGARQWNLRAQNPRWFGGLIDEVRIWNLARSGEEIRGDLHAVLDPDATTGLAGYWRFNERNTNVVLDLVAGRHATLGGGVGARMPARSSTQTVPEPGLGLALFVSCGALASLAKRRQWGDPALRVRDGRRS